MNREEPDQVIVKKGDIAKGISGRYMTFFKKTPPLFTFAQVELDSYLKEQSENSSQEQLRRTKI